MLFMSPACIQRISCIRSKPPLCTAACYKTTELLIIEQSCYERSAESQTSGGSWQHQKAIVVGQL